MGNPYATGFGRIPNKFISRDVIIDEITEALNSDVVSDSAFKLTGIRGTGKTVTLTAVEKKLKADKKKWIVVGLKSTGDLTSDLVAELYSSVRFVADYIDKELNLSAFGIGINIKKKRPVASLDYALRKILEVIKKKNMRVLVTIDEARKTDALVDFIQLFQILIREELPIYIIAAGLYEYIESIENTEGLTFFLRAEKYEMIPLNMNTIAYDYKTVLGVSEETARDMAKLTKGYAFAYQALGKYMWEDKADYPTDEVLLKFDEVLSDNVYRKIWSELAPKDRQYLACFADSDSDTMQVSEILDATGTAHNEWSEPRRRLSAKRIIDTSKRGEISLTLPRFREFIAREV